MMDDTKNVYKSLTNVDIDVQRRIWDERGRGYYGEYLLFSKLYQFLPGNGKILMNLNIPISADKTTEIDLLLIHETGLYVFEIKHYKGTIYGQDTERTWTQYFRTGTKRIFQESRSTKWISFACIKQYLPIYAPEFICCIYQR